MHNNKIAVIGLGYVGLPLAVEFGKCFSTVGFDINRSRIDDLRNCHDHTLEIAQDVLKSVIKTSSLSKKSRLADVSIDGDMSNDSEVETGLYVTYDLNDIRDCNIYIVTVPTPVDKYNRPDLTPLYKASESVGKVLKKGDIVIYESTVYPGVTEDECVPVLEKTSGLKFNEDFYCGYSPERINPGDKEHTVTKIKKVVSGSTPEIGDIVEEIYKTIIVAGVHRAPSIKMAEAAKVIENSQRDINIAFVNELAKIFNKLNIDTNDVLAAAASKWNFLPFKPGLVGGHCIGVDPYYLAQKAQEVGYHPEIILAGRRLNDSMGSYVADEVVKKMLHKGIQVVGSRVLVLGFTFKENCPDVRNTRVIDIINHLKSYHVAVDIHDPWANPEEVMHEYDIKCCREFPTEKYDAVILAVAHREFGYEQVQKACAEKCVVFDVKSVLNKELVDGRL